MAREEFLEELRDCQHGGGIYNEDGHIRADDLLLEYIDDPEISEVYNEIVRYFMY